MTVTRGDGSHAQLPPDQPARIVKPRRPRYTYRPIITLTSTHLLIESTGTLLPTSELGKVLLTEPSSIIVCQGFGEHLDRLRHEFEGNESFQYRVTPRYRESRNQDDGSEEQRPVRIYDSVVNYVGFRDLETRDMRGNKRNKFHYPIDPVHFVRMSIDELYPEQDVSTIQKLLRFGTELRAFCKRQQLEVKPSAGGLASQLLRDPRFYPEPRRKVPRLINAIARPHLPGNHYRLRTTPGMRHPHATYLDMSNSHHSLAEQIDFPDANTLHAYGHYSKPNPNRLYVQIAPGKSHPLLAYHGLFHLRIRVPTVPLSKFPPPCMETGGLKDEWVYSNELATIRELGGVIEGIHACLVSDATEPGMNHYAKWALETINSSPALRPWLKPTLHATYGMLAARPSTFETGFLRAKGHTDNRTEYPLGNVWIPVRAHKARGEIESQIVNVIHRGMIEAEQRLEALRMARELTNSGYRVLAVYADSLFIEGSVPPLLPPPWRVSKFCTDLQFQNATTFRCDEMMHAPGLARASPARARAFATHTSSDGWHHNHTGRYRIAKKPDTIDV